jgi:hypothetical protein
VPSVGLPFAIENLPHDGRPAHRRADARFDHTPMATGIEVIVMGGGCGTLDEIELAISMGKRLVTSWPAMVPLVTPASR